MCVGCTYGMKKAVRVLPGRLLSYIILFAQFRGAVRTADGVNGNLALAEGADLSGGGDGGFFDFLFAQAMQGIQNLNQGEQYNGNDKEVQDGHDESAILEHSTVDGKGQGAEILSHQDTDKGRNQIVDQGVYDSLERSADHDTDCHVNYAAAVDEFLKFCDDFFHNLYTSFPQVSSIIS